MLNKDRKLLTTYTVIFIKYTLYYVGYRKYIGVQFQAFRHKNTYFRPQPKLIPKNKQPIVSNRKFIVKKQTKTKTLKTHIHTHVLHSSVHALRLDDLAAPINRHPAEKRGQRHVVVAVHLQERVDDVRQPPVLHLVLLHLHVRVRICKNVK